MGRVLLPSSLLSGLPHGNDYRGEEKESFLCGLLWHGKYHDLLVLIFLQIWDWGRVKPRASLSSGMDTRVVPR